MNLDTLVIKWTLLKQEQIVAGTLNLCYQWIKVYKQHNIWFQVCQIGLVAWNPIEIETNGDADQITSKYADGIRYI